MSVSRRPARRPSVATTLALVAVVLAAGGADAVAGGASRLITGAQIKNATITSIDVRNNSLTGTDVRNGSLQLGDLSTRAQAALKGQKGDTGAAGLSGAPGAAGAAGAKGEKGEKGDKGEPGQDGQDGTDGQDGAPGLPPSSSTSFTLNASTAHDVFDDAVGRLRLTCGAAGFSTQLEISRPGGAPAPATNFVLFGKDSDSDEIRGGALSGGNSVDVDLGASGSVNVARTYEFRAVRDTTVVDYRIDVITNFQSATACFVMIRELN